LLDRARPFARVNPLHRGSAAELEQVLAAGAEVVMLPMVASRSEAADFAGFVNGRAIVIALIERREALADLPGIVETDGVDEIHIGLNDLALSLGLPNRWATLAGNLLAEACTCAHAAGRAFGFGGIGHALDRSLPIPSDLVYAEYARTGATRALLARSFGVDRQSLATELTRALRRLDEWRHAAPEALEQAHAELARRVRSVAGW